MNNKKSLIYSIIAVLLIVAIVAGGTFAYFQWTSGADDKTSVNVTIEAGQITMHIEPENTVYTGLRPTNNCNNAVAYGDALMTIVNNTGAMAIPSFKLSVKVTKNGTGNLTSDDLSHIHYSVVPVETTADGGKRDSAADCANPVSFTVENKDLYFSGTTGRATGTFATVSTIGEWSDLPSTANEYLPRQFNTVDVTPYGVTFLGKPHTTSYQWFRVYVWIDENYTFTNTGTDITDPLQNAKIEVTWSTNSMLEQVSSIISGGEDEEVKEPGLYNGVIVYNSRGDEPTYDERNFISWNELIDASLISADDWTIMDINGYDDNDLISGGMLIIPSTITEISEGAFYLSEIGDIVLPASLNTIGSDVFLMADNLNQITYEGTKEQWNRIDKAKKWYNGSAIDKIICFDGIISLGGLYNDSGYFVSWGNLIKDNSIVLDENDDTIIVGSSNLYGDLVISDGITIIEDSAFYAYYNSVTLTSIVIPKSVTTIKAFAFDWNTMLNEITYNGTMAEWNEIDKENGWDAIGYEENDYGEGEDINYYYIERVICSDGEINLTY